MSDRLAFGLCLALLFVWSLPGTITLRFALLLAALALLAVRTQRAAGAEFFENMRSATLPLTLITALTLWLLLQATFMSAEPGWALGELRGQWLPALLALGLGLLLGGRIEGRRVLTAVVLVFALQAAIAVSQALWHWYLHREIFTQLVPLTGGKLEMSFVLNILLAILAVDFFCRATDRNPILRLRLVAVAVILVLGLLSSVLAGARNGILALALLSVCLLVAFVFDQRRRIGPLRTTVTAAVVAVALATLTVANYRADPRWHAFAETATIAWEIDHKNDWLDQGSQPLPKLADGRDVDHSAYTRIVFVRAGLRLIGEHPLGYGYGRNAFAHALRMQHPQARLGHAHSGWIDLGVGGGVPALAFWVAFLGSLMWRGWRTFFDGANSYGLLLFLLATGYAGRMVLDSVNKDHMLQMFMFLVGLLLILTAPRREGEQT